MKTKRWLIGWFIMSFALLFIITIIVYIVDPYMHYHKPNIEKFYYTLDNQRSQNDGITKNFDYDAIITGTSMTENFKTSEMNSIFNCNSIKVPYSGGTFKEINDSLTKAIKYNKNIKIIVRGLDMEKFFEDKDKIRTDLGKYPEYLYDDNIFNDVNYIWNRDVIWNRVGVMIKKSINNQKGITSFDEYSRWQDFYTFGKNVFENVSESNEISETHLTEEEKKIIKENIITNVTTVAKENPQITFYYFITPYSAAWWNEIINNGELYKQIEAEQLIIEMILEVDNIKLFSFNNRMDITSNLNNYKDKIHYGEWINSFILKWIYNEQYELTKDNYMKYIEDELNNYSNFNYNSLNNQIDYQNDYYVAALLNEELTGAKPINLFQTYINNLNLKDTNIINDAYNGQSGIEVYNQNKKNITTDEYSGAKINIESIDKYNYLVFYGKRQTNNSKPCIYIFDDKNEEILDFTIKNNEIDDEWNQYIINLSKIKGNVNIIFNAYEKNSADIETKYIYSNAILY